MLLRRWLFLQSKGGTEVLILAAGVEPIFRFPKQDWNFRNASEASKVYNLDFHAQKYVNLSCGLHKDPQCVVFESLNFRAFGYFVSNAT